MQNLRVTLGLLLALIASGRAATQPQSPAPERLTSLVDPFIGTGGHGHTYPGPSLPFGMIQPGPDTRTDGWDSCSGYHYSDSRIIGFSHTHLSGTGIPDYNDILVMPTTGSAGMLERRADGTPGYSSAFSHSEEIAEPGYYAVTLKDHGIRAELTTTLRVGIHRYTFASSTQKAVVLNLAHRDQVLDSSLNIVSDREIEGSRQSKSWAKDQRLFFVIRFSGPFGTPGAHHGVPPEVVFHFEGPETSLLVKVGISAVSIEGARKNLDAELPGWDFDAVRKAASDAWEKELGRIRVDGGTRDQRVVFYTALYHAMLTPNVYMDVDGQYLGRDMKPHHADGFTYYSVFSLWDTFRALHPLLTLIDRARTADFVKTMLAQYRDGGRLPVWELAATVECNPLIGPQLFDAVNAIMAKKQLPKRTAVQEGVFEQSQAAAELPNRKY